MSHDTNGTHPHDDTRTALPQTVLARVWDDLKGPECKENV